MFLNVKCLAGASGWCSRSVCSSFSQSSHVALRSSPDNRLNIGPRCNDSEACGLKVIELTRFSEYFKHL